MLETKTERLEREKARVEEANEVVMVMLRELVPDLDARCEVAGAIGRLQAACWLEGLACGQR